MTKPRAILLVAPKIPFGVDDYTARALTRLGHRVTWFDTAPYYRRGGRLAAYVQNRLACGPNIDALNRDLAKAATGHDLIWVHKGLFVRCATLAALPMPKLHATLDDPFINRGEPTWRLFHQAIPAYDVLGFPSDAHRADYLAHGARGLVLTPFYFEPSLHVEALGAKKLYDVVFIGSPYGNRKAVILDLIDRYGLNVHVFGNRWDHVASASELRRMHWSGERAGPDYVATLNAAKIALGFVTHDQRHDSAHRWPEITACGTLLLAEHTARAAAWFEPDREACFFRDSGQAADHIRKLLADEPKRAAIAAAGSKRARATMAIDLRIQDLLAAADL